MIPELCAFISCADIRPSGVYGDFTEQGTGDTPSIEDISPGYSTGRNFPSAPPKNSQSYISLYTTERESLLGAVNGQPQIYGRVHMWYQTQPQIYSRVHKLNANQHEIYGRVHMWYPTPSQIYSRLRMWHPTQPKIYSRVHLWQPTNPKYVV